MKKIRASYSLLHAWQEGRINDALLSYFHVPHPTPYNYINGRKWDEYCQEYIKNHSSLPPEWGGDKLNDPVVQLKLNVPYNALCSLTVVYDAYSKNDELLDELKSGHSMSANQYSRTYQLPLYFLAAKIAKLPIQKARVIRYNPKVDKQDRAILYNAKHLVAKAQNYLDTLVPEIYEYFDSNNLFEKTDVEMAKLLKGN